MKFEKFVVNKEMTKIIKKLIIGNNGAKVSAIALFDTRTCRSLIKSEVAERVENQKTDNGANNYCVADVQIAGRVLNGKFRVLEKLHRDVDAVIGIDLMLRWRFAIDLESRELVFET